MKTAIEELREHFKVPLIYLEMMKVAIDWDKYIEKEKQQIYDAFEAGGGMFDDPEQYYEAIYTHNN
jgi:hypothetical protein